MKEFNLKEVLAGAKVCTVDGRKARVVCTDRKNADFPVLVLVTEADGKETFSSYTIKGRFLALADGTHPNDLVMVLVNRHAWINIYNDSLRGMHRYDTAAEADKDAMPDRIACIKIQWEG